MYGAIETNGINDEVRAVRERVHASGVTVDLADKRLVRITRLRLVSDPGFPMWDLSYCYGRLADGTDVSVRLPEHQFPKRDLNAALIAMCKGAGRYGKGLGIFDPLVLSKFYG
jgi:hypothetical protein